MWSLRDIAARTIADSFNGPWWWEPTHWQRLHERGAPTETDAPRTHRNSLAFNVMVTVSLAVTGSPLEPERRRCADGASRRAHTSLGTMG